MFTCGLLLTADVLWAAAIVTALQADFPGWANHDFRMYDAFGSGMRMFMPRKLLQGNPDSPIWSRPDNHDDLNTLAALNMALSIYDSLHLGSLVVRVSAESHLL